MSGDWPTKKSLAWLKERYAVVERVESGRRRTFYTTDLLGFADILAFNDHQVVLVQTTSEHNFNARLAKITASKLARAWLRGGSRRILLQGWKQDDVSEPYKQMWIPSW